MPPGKQFSFETKRFSFETTRKRFSFEIKEKAE